LDPKKTLQNSITAGFTESLHRDPTDSCGDFTVFHGKPWYTPVYEQNPDDQFQVESSDETPTAYLMLSVLGAVAQFERDSIRERQRVGTPWPNNEAHTPGVKRL
jgi:Resolvase, N terminal domain